MSVVTRAASGGTFSTLEACVHQGEKTDESGAYSLAEQPGYASSAEVMEQDLSPYNTLDGMNSLTWSAIVSGLASRDVDACVNAASRLHSESSAEDIPALLGLLETGDFFVREAAAWPLAELAGLDHLLQLLQAYQRGFDEGHDNDGFSAALLEIPALFPAEARRVIESLARSSGEPVRGHAEWLLEFCQPEGAR